MKKLQVAVIVSTVSAFAITTLVFGWPKNLSEADGFAGLVAAILTSASLILLVLTLEKQQENQRQATRDGFLSLQVQALIALIEDDRLKLESMSAKYRETGKKTTAFSSVQQRYQLRVAKLNSIMGKELRLPDVTEMPAGS